MAIYTLGACILSGFGLIVVLLYLLFCLWSEYRVLAMSCRYCFYYGKLCGVGKGIVAPLFVKKGDPKVFLEKAIGWKELVPDFLVFLVPALGGIIHLFLQFNLLTLGLIAVIVILALPCVGFMRSCLICTGCKQRELGCPAEKWFGKKEK
ncbi:MAG: hypothetical protein WCT39_00515 [Candidatus Margulisiibacteriota bacterium]